MGKSLFIFATIWPFDIYCLRFTEKRSGHSDNDSGHSSPSGEDELCSLLGRASLSSSTNGSVASDSSNEDHITGNEDEATTTTAPATSSIISAPTSWKPFVSCCNNSRATELTTTGLSGRALVRNLERVDTSFSSIFDRLDSDRGSGWSTGDLLPNESSIPDSFFTPRNPSPSPLWSSQSYVEPDIWGRPMPPTPTTYGHVGRPQYQSNRQHQSYRPQINTNSYNSVRPTANSYTPRSTVRTGGHGDSDSNALIYGQLPGHRAPEDRVQNILRFYAIFLDNLHPKTDESKLVQIFSKYGTIRDIKIKKVLGVTSTYACVEYNDYESPERAVTDALNDTIPKMDLVFDLKMPLVVKFTPSGEQRRNLSSGSLAWNWAKAMIERSGECFEWRFNSSCSAGRHCYRTHVVKHRCVDTLKSFSLWSQYLSHCFKQSQGTVIEANFQKKYSCRLKISSQKESARPAAVDSKCPIVTKTLLVTMVSPMPQYIFNCSFLIIMYQLYPSATQVISPTFKSTTFNSITIIINLIYYYY